MSGQQREIWAMAASKNACKLPLLIPQEVLEVGLAWRRLKRQAQHCWSMSGRDDPLSGPTGMAAFPGPGSWLLPEVLSLCKGA